MKIRPDVKQTLRHYGCFSPGAHFIVDGQYGSTGKGLMASVYAEAGGRMIDVVTTNAGPNSGHTAFSPDGTRVMTQQIPVASVMLRLAGVQAMCVLNAGAIIDPSILFAEIQMWDINDDDLFIHPNAAMIEDIDRIAEQDGSIAAIASTGKGVGHALARKIMRQGNVASTMTTNGLVGVFDMAGALTRRNSTILVETAQGFSLGVNGRFYPHTTSRECTVQQAAADARIPLSKIRTKIACYRAYPIRVGNTDKGQSGGCYDDQQETSWEKIGQTPELTSVTKRVRRVFTWSRQQFRESLSVNEPDVIFLNFANYCKPAEFDDLIASVYADYRNTLGQEVPLLLLGYGPNNGDVVIA